MVYEIFLNLPVGNGEEEEDDDENDEEEESGEEEARREHLVGFVTFFGGTHHNAHMPGETEAQGMTEVFTLNNLLVRMKDSREFEERRLEFDFEPLGLLPPPKEGVTTRIMVQPAAKATIRRLRVTAT